MAVIGWNYGRWVGGLHGGGRGRPAFCSELAWGRRGGSGGLSGVSLGQGGREGTRGRIPASG